MQFCLFARFFACFRFSLQCFKQTNKIAFLAAFLAVSRVFSPFLCICLCRHKRPLFWPLLAVNFSMHPQPLIDPHRDRGCLSELFFLKFFFSIFFPFCTFPRFFLFFYFFSASLLVLYLTDNSHFACHAIYFSENEEVFYLTAI